MTTSTEPTFEDLRRYLHQIGHQLLDTTLLDEGVVPDALSELEALKTLLLDENDSHMAKYRALYQHLEQVDLTQAAGQRQVEQLKTELDSKLLALDEETPVRGKGRKTFLCGEAGILALEREARLSLMDRLLRPQEEQWVQHISKAPQLRPGLYALAFDYQDSRVDIAGAFVLTEQTDPLVQTLADAESVGGVLLFTPFQGLESFDSLAALDASLLARMHIPAWRNRFNSLLPKAMQHLDRAGIWPLELELIEDKPLFEHLYDAQLDKRSLDIERALSLTDNPTQSARHLIRELDEAVRAALPDLGPRLEMRAHLLLERSLLLSAPDWFRSADLNKRTQLAQHLSHYNQARQALLELSGPAQSPQTLGRAQLLERLDAELDIYDLTPEHIQVSTLRTVPGAARYAHTLNLVQLVVHGLHPGDEQPGSDFLSKTRVTYKDGALPEDYLELTPSYLATLIPTLQPRLGFRLAQQELHSHPAYQPAVERLLDTRITALAYTARLQNHLNDDDLALIESLRSGPVTGLSAETVSLHGAALNALWVLRQVDPQGELQRLLLCTPQAPRQQQFWAFRNEADCQAHILAWSQDKTPPQEGSDRRTMATYLLEQLPLRFRPSMQTVLDGLSFIPARKEHLKVTFSAYTTQALCITALAQQTLIAQEEDYNYTTPLWYRSASRADRQKLTALATDVEGALSVYNADPLSEANFESFETFLHRTAKTALNTLLGRPQNDVDPDTVWAHAPRTLGARTPAPLNYTQLYRDGYEDGIGFINEKFSAAATFSGLPGIDLSTLTAQKVARSVTGVWIGKRYTDEVHAKLQSPDSPGYASRRSITLAITQRQMQHAALESRLTGHISGADLDWLNLAIEHLGDTTPATRNTYRVHRLTLDGEWVIDCCLFSNTTNPTLLYTPNAPDGVAFREARLFNYLLKNVDGMLDYCLSRVPLASQRRVRLRLEDIRRQLPDSLDKTTPSVARHDPITHVAPLADIRRELFDLKLQRKIDDVHATTVNRTQMIMGILWTCVEWVAAVITVPFPLWSLSAGILLAFKDGMLALSAYHEGQHDEALQHFVGYLFNSVGAVATDLRPALKGLTLSARQRHLARLIRHTPVESRAMTLIKQMQPPAPPESAMQPVYFRGQALWARQQPDPLGRFLLFSWDPVQGKFNSTAILANPDSQGRWVRSGLAGGAPKYEKLPDSQTALAQYELAEAHHQTLKLAHTPDFFANLERGDVILDKHMRDMGYVERHLAKEAHLKQVATLSTDAKAFFSGLAPIPPRADVLEIAAQASHGEIFETAFKENRLLILGETDPASIASKQLLIENLKAADIKRLYIQYLPSEVFRAKLEKMNRGGSMRNIKMWLRNLDHHLGFAKHSPFSYTQLVLEARKHNIAVHGLDSSSAYRLERIFQSDSEYALVAQDNALTNFYAHKVLEADIKHTPGERWVVLVDQRRVSTYNHVPGLADLQKTLGIRVEDVAEGRQGQIVKDVPGAIPGDPNAKADFKLTLPTAYRRAATLEPAGPSTRPPVAAKKHFSEFDTDPAHQQALIQLERVPKGLDHRYAPVGDQQATRAFNGFQATRKRLDDAAKTFFEQRTVRPRSSLPTLTANTSAEAFAQDLIKRGRNLVLGEAHSSASSKQWIKGYLKQMKQHGTGKRTLYMEHLQTDFHQADLDTLHNTGKMPAALKAYLQYLDAGHMGDHAGAHTFTSVVETAAKYKIRVRALDCMASYRVKDLSQSALKRTRMFNYMAHHVIDADQAAEGPHLWVAFMGNSYTNPHRGIPGVATLQDAVSLHIHEVAPGQAKPLHAGYWKVVREDQPGQPWVALGSDFQQDIASAARAPYVPVVVDRSSIQRPGDFLIERPSLTESNLLHRSSSNELVSTPIQIDENGQFHIDRWPSIRDRRYPTQHDLSNDLITTVGLTPLAF